MTYISDTRKFNQLSDAVKPYLGWSLPYGEKSLNCEERYFDCVEFHVEGFFPYIKALAALSADQEFYLYNLDDISIKEFYRIFRKYPIVEIKTDINEEGYFLSISEEPGEEIPGFYGVFYTSTYAIFSESLNWHIYGEYNIELARLVSKVGLPPDSLFPHDFFTEEEAMARIKLLDTPIPEPPP